MMKIQQSILISVLTLCISSPAIAQTQAPSTVAATVNGVKVFNKDLDLMVKAAEASGAKDSPDLRNAILNDLVIREAILQDVKKNSLEKRGDNEARIKIANQNILIDLWFAEFMKAHPITDAEIRAEYDRQAAITKDGKNSNEYKISQIVVATEADANDVITKLNGGSNFNQLAKEKSLDKQSAANGGEITNWILPDQLVPPLGDTVVGLTKGKVSVKAVRTNLGWHVVRLDDMRKFKLPTFEESKNIISQSFLNRRKQEAISDLMKKATVVPAK
jgi:peptidyl-prolyl cis-trans isomerase C